MKRFKTITGEELLAKELEEIPFVVENLLPIGLSILGGAAKIGKSWLALWLCISVANGEQVFGFETTKSSTLYLCFEDNEIRIQNRLLDITEDAPSNVHFCTEIAKLGGELETKIVNFVAENPDTRLIIIDTLQTVRNNSDSSYASDYAELLSLKKIADELKIAILLIHHFRKSKDSDVFNQLTGSTGLQGAVDTMFTLSKSARGEKTALLNCIGRDIFQRELEVERDENNSWVKISDSNSEANISDFNFVNSVVNFMKNRDDFCGTATELSSLLSSFCDDKFSVKIISKKIKKLSKSLEKHGILGNSYRNSKARFIELVRVSDENDDKFPLEKKLSLSSYQSSPMLQI